MKGNWIQEQLVDISLVIQRSLKSTDFIVLTIVQELLNLEILGSLKMAKLVRV